MYRVAICERVRQGGYASVGVDFEEPFFLFTDINYRYLRRQNNTSNYLLGVVRQMKLCNLNQMSVNKQASFIELRL